MDEGKSIEVEVTREMIRAGIGELIDYEGGGMTAGEMIKNVFKAMFAVSPLCHALESRGHAPDQTPPLEYPQSSPQFQGLPDEPEFSKGAV